MLREADFDKLAARVVEQFLSGRSKLADAAAAEASSVGLNPDQIRRLVEAANTMTFLRMMDQRKAEGAPDLLHEFDPIDARQVIRIVIDNAGVHVEPFAGGQAEPQFDEGELPDEMSAVRTNPTEGEPGHTDSPEVAECEEECHDKLDPPDVRTKKRSPAGSDSSAGATPKPSPSKKAAQLDMRIRKLAALFEDERRQVEWSFDETFRRLSDRFKLAHGPSYEVFEKDAAAEHGNAIGIGLLNLLRAERHLGPLTPQQLEKTAVLTARHISDDSPELELFESLVKIAREAAGLEQAIIWLRERCPN